MLYAESHAQVLTETLCMRMQDLVIGKHHRTCTWNEAIHVSYMVLDYAAGKQRYFSPEQEHPVGCSSISFTVKTPNWIANYTIDYRYTGIHQYEQ